MNDGANLCKQTHVERPLPCHFIKATLLKLLYTVMNLFISAAAQL